ncbi:hypothetical protein [Sphingomonas sp.]|uniref:hypothetical protein n=1 Tax=Sphingomonas sp. TaxID=28214 RepID=UPI001B25A353|nr:hypothetical protein [Sphingomonas sp.]MBO9712288.1 hypothetical protein [Sphingomonas sp.]
MIRFALPPALLIAALAAALVPLLPRHEAPPAAIPGWPAEYEGRALRPIAPAPEDARLAAGFPGAIARFSDGKRQVVLRQVSHATRQLHPPGDCFRALGYAIEPAPMRVTAEGPASCFTARRDGGTLLVCERIRGADGRSFADASAWYWPALLGSSRGPWLAATTVEPVG